MDIMMMSDETMSKDDFRAALVELCGDASDETLSNAAEALFNLTPRAIRRLIDGERTVRGALVVAVQLRLREKRGR